MSEELILVKQIAKLLDDKKAQDIIALDVSHLTVITDYMVIASGRSVLQTRSLADDLDDKMAELGIPLRTREGYQEARWIVMDYGTALVHIFHPEESSGYQEDPAPQCNMVLSHYRHIWFQHHSELF